MRSFKRYPMAGPNRNRRPNLFGRALLAIGRFIRWMTARPHQRGRTPRGYR